MVDVGGVDFPHPSCASQTKGLTWPGVGDLGLIRASGRVKGLPPPTTRTKQVKEGGWSRLCGFLIRSPGLSLCFFPSRDDPHRSPPGPPTRAVEAALGDPLGVSDELLLAASPRTRRSSGPGDGPVPTSGTLHAGPAALWPERG